ncbi:MAG: hypothetical protein HPY81_00830 [Firmicutes bacterium]|nr:hypothetical protein [Bacillota bacterium]
MHTIYRIIDANLNRAREGLRVVEEVARFILNDQVLTDSIKQLRHDLLQAEFSIPNASELLVKRNTDGDVGTELARDGQTPRVNLTDLVRANLRRIQEAMRVLEEFGKLLSPEIGVSFKKIRYRCYTLEQTIINKLGGISRA